MLIFVPNEQAYGFIHHHDPALPGAVQKEWTEYTEVMERMGQRMNEAMQQYETLSTTRTGQLERQLDKIEDLRSQQQAALPTDAGP